MLPAANGGTGHRSQPSDPRSGTLPPSCPITPCRRSIRSDWIGPGADRRAAGGRCRSVASKRSVQKSTGLSRSELRPVNAGQGCAMERAVREGDTGLHHTAKTRRCPLVRNQQAGSELPRWSVGTTTFKPNSQRTSVGFGRGLHHRFARHHNQASCGSARARSAIMPDTPLDFNTCSRVFRQGVQSGTAEIRRERPRAPVARATQTTAVKSRRRALVATKRARRRGGKSVECAPRFNACRRTSAGTRSARGRCRSRAACA
jgi:hypothetical protein